MEEKITYVTDYAYTGNIAINGKPLSNKQLYEIITSQNMTISRLLTDKGNQLKLLRDIYNYIERGAYNKAKIIIKDTLNT